MKKIAYWHVIIGFFAIILLAFWRQNGERSLGIARSWFEADTLSEPARQAILDSIERIDSADLAVFEAGIAPPPVFEQSGDRFRIRFGQNNTKPLVFVERQPQKDTTNWTEIHRFEGGKNGVSVEDFDGDKLSDLVVNNKRGGNELWLFAPQNRNFQKVGNFGQLSTLKYHVFYETLYLDSLAHLKARAGQVFYSRLMRISNFKTQTLGELVAKGDTLGNVAELQIFYQNQLLQTIDGSVLKGYYKNETFDTDDFLKTFWHNNFKNFLKN